MENKSNDLLEKAREAGKEMKEAGVTPLQKANEGQLGNLSTGGKGGNGGNTGNDSGAARILHQEQARSR